MQAQIVVQSQGRRGSFMFPPSLVPNIKKKKKPTWWEWSWALGHSPNALALQHGCGSRQMPRCQNREAAPKVIDLGTRALAQSPSALAAQHIEKKTVVALILQCLGNLAWAAILGLAERPIWLFMHKTYFFMQFCGYLCLIRGLQWTSCVFGGLN